MPKVSVIVTAYNIMAYLPETVNSVLQQTYTDFEIIVINDGSTDNIVQWAQQVRDPRVRLVSQPNMGLSEACNTGIRHVRGEYVAFMDGDDLWESTKLAKQVAILDGCPDIGIVYTWVTYMSEEGKSTGRVVKTEAEGYIWEQLIEVNQIECGSVALIRRACFDKIGLLDTNLKSYSQDWDLWLRLALHYQFKVIREPLVYYRQRLNSGSRKIEPMERSFKIVLEKAFNAAPPKLKPLVDHGYGFAYFCLAWKALQNGQPDYKTAKKFQKIALDKHPQRFLTKENLRLTVAITLMQWFGNQNYLKILRWMHLGRSLLSPNSAIAK